MHNLLKRLLIFVLTVSLVAGAALTLPRLMDRVMADTIGTTMVIAEELDPGGLPVTLMPETTLNPVATLGPMRTAAPSPTPMASHPNAVTAVPIHTGNMPFPQITLSPASEAVFEVPLPSPMPPGDDAPLTQVPPADWRAVLPSGDAAGLLANLPQGWQKALGNLTEQDMARFQVFSLPRAVTLAEDRLPRNLAQQKLFTGVLDNLNNNPIFVPGQDVLLDLMDLSFSAFTLGENGELATLLATNRLLMPLRVLEFNAMNDRQMLQPQEYVETRGLLVEQARLDMQRTDSPALKRSLDLVAQLMWDDKPWQLSVMDAEAYLCQEDWEYFCFGHHVKAVDMQTGSVYTLTTDLEGSRIIGIATEGAEPYLTTYGRLLDTMRQMSLGRPFPIAEDGAHALSLMERLSGVPFSRQEQLWQVSQGSGSLMSESGDTVLEYFSVDAQPTDADTRRIDAQGKVFSSYSLMLHSDSTLRSYVRNYDPIGSANMEGFAHDEKTTLRQRARVIDKEQPGFAKLAEEALQRPDAIIAEQLARINSESLSFSLLDIGGINITHHTPSNGAEPFWTLSINFRLQESSTQRDYWTEVELLGNGQTALVHLTVGR